MTRETVTRALTELRTKMLISTKGPSVLIRNKPALEAMVAVKAWNSGRNRCVCSLTLYIATS